MVGLGETESRDAEAVEEGAECVVREGVGVPLGHDDDGLFGLACLFFRRCGVPAGVDGVVLGIDGADG